ncbi:MAG: acyl--CoA ligase [Lentisphaeria bacterium]|nr:acyl--CoA ligase [Lentisphaeria bacterium]
MNIYSSIVEENASWQGIAVREKEKEYSYPRLFQDVEKVSSSLAEAGVAALDRCAFIADDSYAYIVYSLAILKRDAALIPLSTRAVKTELASMLESLPWEYLIVSEAYAEKHTGPGEQVSLPFSFTLKKNPRTHEKTRLPDTETPAFIRFSSGTTGKNKGIVLSHKSVLERTSACTHLDIQRGENVLWVLDMAYHFVVTILLFLRRGSSIILCGHPVETEMARCLSRFPVTLLYATPYHYQIMAKSPLYSAELLKQTRMAVSTAMGLPQDTAESFRNKFGFPLNQAYGIIEIGLPCINGGSSGKSKPGSVGRPEAPYEIKIASPDDKGIGEILLRGPGMFDAYLSPFSLREEVCKEGFFDTGDLGYLDEEGFLFIAGRSKNVIVFAGMKIFPYEVENILLGHPAVEEVRVRGVPMKGFGEIPVAEIVLKSGFAGNGELRNDLRKFCYARLSEYKVPKDFIFVKELKKTASGKIART